MFPRLYATEPLKKSENILNSIKCKIEVTDFKENQINSIFQKTFFTLISRFTNSNNIDIQNVKFHNTTNDKLKISTISIDYSNLTQIESENEKSNINKLKFKNGDIVLISDLDKTDFDSNYKIYFENVSLIGLKTKNNSFYLITSNQFIPISFLNNFSKQFSNLFNYFIKNFEKNNQIELIPQTKKLDFFPNDILSILNPKPIISSGPCLLHQYVFNHKDSKNIAFKYLSRDGKIHLELSYKELINLVLQFLHDKLDTKIDPIMKTNSNTVCLNDNVNQIIPIMVPQSPYLYISILATLSSGAAYCPIGIDAPPDRVKYIIKDTSAKKVIISKDYIHYLDNSFINENNLNIIQIDHNKIDFSKELELYDTNSNFQCELNFNDYMKPDNLAYCMYTSGSTGTPKGVKLSHMNATQAIQSHCKFIPHFNCILNFASPTFDVSVIEIFFPFLLGVTLAASDRGFMLTNLEKSIHILQVDALELTPTIASLLSTRIMPQVKVLMTIGESLTQNVRDKFAGKILYNTYGPTEAAIQCTATQELFKPEYLCSNIGTPLESVTALIVQIQDKTESNTITPLPIGWVGELAISGPQVSQGYLNQQSLTSKVFIHDKIFGNTYLTGDLARVLPDGQILYLGRASDTQIKLHGQRIELGEIESVVSNCAFSILQKHISAVAVLINNMIYCLTNIPMSNFDKLMDLIKENLPRYMIPSEIFYIDSIPLLPSGKTNRREVKLIIEKLLEKDKISSVSLEKPKNVFFSKLETLVSQIFEEISGKKPVSPQDTLANLGIDSLDAIFVAKKLLAKGYYINVAQIISASSIFSIGKLLVENDKRGYENTSFITDSSINEALQSNEKLREQKIKNVNIKSFDPCTAFQEGVLYETFKTGYLYWNKHFLNISLKVPIEKLLDSFKRLINNNDILRSGFQTFPTEDTTFIRVIFNEFDARQILILNETDCLATKIKELSEILYRDPEISLFNPPFIIVLKKSIADYNVAIFIHHALYDGWSWNLILKDLDSLLSNNTCIKRPSFSNFVYYLRESVGSVSSLKYWESLLSGGNLSQLNFKENSSNSTKKHIRIYEKFLDDIDYLHLKNVSRELGVGIQIIFYFAWALLIHSITDSDDIIIGIISSGRVSSFQNVDSCIGPFMNILPLRVKLNRNESIQVILNAINHQSNNMILYPCDLFHLLGNMKDKMNMPLKKRFDSIIGWQKTSFTTNLSSYISETRSEEHTDMPILVELFPLKDCSQGVKLSICFDESLIDLTLINYFSKNISTVINLILFKSLNSKVGKILNSYNSLIQESYLNSELRSIKDMHNRDSNSIKLNIKLDSNNKFNFLRKEYSSIKIVYSFGKSILFLAVDDFPKPLLNNGFLLTEYYDYHNAVKAKILIKAVYDTIISRVPMKNIPDAIFPVHYDFLKHIDSRSISKKELSFLLNEFSIINNKDYVSIKNNVVTFLSYVLNKSKDKIINSCSLQKMGLDSLASIKFISLLKEKGYSITLADIYENSSIDSISKCILKEKNVDTLEIFPEAEKLSQILYYRFFNIISDLGFKSGYIVPALPIQTAMLTSYLIDSFSYINTVVIKSKNRSVYLSSLLNAFEKCSSLSFFRTSFVKTGDKEYPYLQFFHNTKLMRISINQKIISNDFLSDPYVITIYSEDLNLVNKVEIKFHHALADGIGMFHLVKALNYSYSNLKMFNKTPEIINAYSYSLQNCKNDYIKASDFSNLYSGVQSTLLSNTFSVDCKRKWCFVTKVFDFSKQIQNIKNYQVSLLSLIQSSWYLLLYMLLDKEDICFGTTLLGRDIPIKNSHKLIGCFFNVLPVRVKSLNFNTILNLVEYFQNFNSEISKISHISLKSLTTTYCQNQKRMFDTAVNLHISSTLLEETESNILELFSHSGSTDYSALIEFHLKDDIATCEFQYLSNIFNEKISNVIMNNFVLILDFLSDNLEESMNTMLASLISRVSIDEINEIKIMRSNNLDIIHTKNNLNLEAKESTKITEIKSILAEVSGVSINLIKDDSSIYSLGLDSISSIYIAQKAVERGIDISAIDVLENSTVLLLSNFVKNFKNDNYIEHPSDLSTYQFQKFQNDNAFIINRFKPKNATISLFPCTAFQASILSQFFMSSGDLYFNYFIYEIRTQIDASLFINNCRLIMNDVNIFRTGFIPIPDTNIGFGQILYEKSTNLLNSNIILKSFNTKDFFTDFICQHEFLKKKAFENCHLPQFFLTVFHNNGEAKYLMISANHATFDETTIFYIKEMIFRKYITSNFKETPTGNYNEALFVINQRSWELGQSACKLFWNKYLSNFLYTQLPVYNSTKNNSNKLISITKRRIMSKEDIIKCCVSFEASMHSICLLVFSKLLGFYVGERAVTFGLVLSGRSYLSELKNIIFPCVSTVPFNIQFQGSNFDICQQISKDVSHLLKYMFTPEKLIKKYAGITSKRLYEILFVMQENRPQQKEDLVLKFDDQGNTGFLFSFEAYFENDGFLTVKAMGVESCMPKEQIDLFLLQYTFMLQHLNELVHNDVLSINDNFPTELLSIIPPLEPYIKSSCNLLHDLVKRTSEKNPKNIAIEYAEGENAITANISKFSYKELESASNSIANFLLSCNVKLNENIGLCFNKSYLGSISMYGVLKAGGTILSIDPRAPKDRKLYIATDSNMRILLTHEELLDKLAGLDIQIITVEAVINKFSNSPPTMKVVPNSDNIAYCLYTSGSTGVPKGCLISHENSVQALMAFTRLFSDRTDNNSKFLAFASYHFDVSILEHFWSWSQGITVVCASRDLILSDLVSTIKTFNISHIDLTPSLASTLPVQELDCLRIFITGGEMLKSEILEIWGNSGVIYNAYGPTEATIGVTMRKNVPSNGIPSNIGYQFDNVGTIVLSDSNNSPVLKGAIGELCVYGKLVGKGYINREEQTEKSFPYNTIVSERIYRTGDLVRLLPDYSIDLIGRKDSQVKLRGQRLETEEINQVIRSIEPSVKNIVTLVIKHAKTKREHLVTFYSLNAANKGNSISYPLFEDHFIELNSKIRDVCVKKLPPYMIPTYFIPLNYFPLSLNNKTDEKQLQKIFCDIDFTKSLIKQDSTLVESCNEFENRVKSILSELSKTSVQNINKHTTIFELGFDSISAVYLAKRLSEIKPINISTLMSFPSCSSIAKSLSSKESELNLNPFTEKFDAEKFYSNNIGKVLKQSSFKEEEISGVYPCTPLQDGIIARCLTANFKTFYFNSFIYELNDEFDIEILKKSWNIFIKRNEIFRTFFVSTTNGIVQVVLKSFHPEWYFFNEPKFSSKILNELNDIDPFNFPPYRFFIFHDNKKYKVILKIFHSLYDAYSIELMNNEIEDIYLGKKLSQSFSFSDAVMKINSLNYKVAENYWLDSMKDIQLCKFETKYEEKGSFVLNSLTNISSKTLSQTASNLKCTSFSLLQTAWAISLQNLLNKSSIVFGVIYSGRNLLINGAEKLIGPLFNVLPVAVDLSRYNTYDTLVKKIHDLNVSRIPFHHTPLRLIQKCLGLPTSASLFDSLFVYFKSASNNTSKLWKSFNVTDSEADYPLSIEVVEDSHINSHLKLTLALRREYFNNDEGKKILNLFNSILTNLCTHPQAELHLNNILPINITSPKKELLLNPSEKRLMNKTALIIRDVVAQISNVSNVNNIDGNTSLFELGLDSIDAIKVAAGLKEHGIFVPISKLMLYPTPNALAQYLESLKSKTKETTVLNFKSLDNYILSVIDLKLDYFPCTPLQDGIISQMLSSNYHKYYNHELQQINRNTDICKLIESWRHIYYNTKVLNSRFIDISSFEGIKWLYKSHFCMLIEKEFDLPLFYHNLENEDLEKKVAALITEIKKTSDIFLKPLFRIDIIRTLQETYFLVSIPHCLYDAVSLNAIYTDIETYYQTKIYRKRPLFKNKLYSILKNAACEEDRDFWLKNMEGSVAYSFPNLNGAHMNSSSAFVFYEHVSKMSAQEARNESKNLGVTLKTVTQTCWAKILSGILNSNDVIFNTVYSGRLSEEEEQIIFPTFCSLPVRIQIIKDSQELLKNVQILNNKMLNYQFYPMSEINSFISFHGNSSIDTLFIFQNENSKGHNQLWKINSGFASTEYTVAIEIVVSGDELIWKISCDPRFVPVAQAKNFLLQLDKLLHEFLNKDVNKFVLPLIYSMENSPSILLEKKLKGLHELFEQSVLLFPNLPALEYNSLDNCQNTNIIYSYKELNILTNKVANAILKFSVKGIVPILIERSIEQYISVLGILKAGLSYHIIDNESPVSRIESIIKDVDPPFVLISDTTKDIIQYRTLVSISSLLNEKNENDPKVAINEDNLAYVCYTSGSTGKPKGVGITHKNALNAMRSFQHILEFSAEDRFLQFANCFFDVIQFEMHFSWACGMTLVSAPKDKLLRELPKALNLLKITHVDLTPSVVSLLKNSKLPFIKVFVCGGEPLSRKILEEWGGTNILYNFYGPVEATIGCTAFPKVFKETNPLNIGKPWPTCSAYVVGDDRELLPRGAIGELLIGGYQVAKGYLNLPELTKEKFIYFNGERVYRTGDYVKMLSNGEIEFVGRTDDMVKLNAVRIELGEVSSVIAGATDKIVECRTLVIRLPNALRDQLISFIGINVPENDLNSVTEDVCEIINIASRHASEILPLWMIPVYIIPVSKIPLKTTGKADDEYLKNIFNKLDNEYLKKISKSKDIGNVIDEKVENNILEIISGISGIQKNTISRSHTLFQLGLDSISAIKVSSELRKQNYYISVSDLLKAASIERICLYFNNKIKRPDLRMNKQTKKIKYDNFKNSIMTKLKNNNFVISEIENVFPATPMQEYTLSLWGQSRYNLFFNVFKYESAYLLSDNKLNNAWIQLQKENPILRTIFDLSTDKRFPFVQIVSSKCVDCINVKCSLNMKLVNMDDHKVPKNRYVYLYHFYDDNKSLIYLKIHHALYDAWSLPLLIKRLIELYSEVEETNQSFGLTSKFILMTTIESEEVNLKKWTNVLKKCDSTLAGGHDRSTRQYCSRTELLSKAITVNLNVMENFCAKLNISFQNLVFAAFASTFHKFFKKKYNSDKIVIGVYVSGRNVELDEIELLPYPTINIIPLAIDCSDGKKIIDIAKEISETMIEINGYEQISLRKIYETMGLKLDTAINFVKTANDSNSLGFKSLKPIENYSEMDNYLIDDSTFELKKILKDEEFGYEICFDFELAIKDNILEVGIFADETVLSQSKAKKFNSIFVETLRDALN